MTLIEQAERAHGATPPRLVWVDVAKAIAITLVVVHHVVIFGDAAGWLPPLISNLNQQAGAVRMPLFFLTSGLFAGTALRRPWAVVARKRILFFAYLYVLWTSIRFLLFQVIPDVRWNGVDGDVHALLLSPLLPGTGLWFIYALAVFSVLAKATLRVPVGVQLGVAAAMSAVIGSGLIDIGNFAWRNMLMYYMFFLVGMHLRHHVFELAERTTPVGVVVLGVATGVGLVVMHVTGARAIPSLWLVQSCIAVSFGVALSVLVARRILLARLLRVIGERTLPVYLMHVPWVALAVAVIEEVVAPGGAVGSLLVLALAAMAIAITLTTYGPVRRVAPWLFTLPSRSTAAAQS